MKTTCIIQARMGSTRLPGKILMEIAGKPMLRHIVERVRKCRCVDEVVVATTKRWEDKKVIELCTKIKCSYFEGSESDVLDRYYKSAIKYNSDIIIRVTGDCPLVDFNQIDRMIEIQKKAKADYVENVDVGLPRGIGAEIFTMDALKKSWLEGNEPHHREHVDEYIIENPQKFRTAKLPVEQWMKKDCRLTVDTNEDLQLIKEIYGRLYRGIPIEFKDVISLLDKNPELSKINSHIVQKKVK